MKMQVVIFQANHYDMQDNKGLSVRILGDYEETNNKFGLSVTDATVTNYDVLKKLQKHGKDFPALFNADVTFTTKKASNGKEIPALSVIDLEFVQAMELVPKSTVGAK